jgi:predicted nucleic acid-binding protein
MSKLWNHAARDARFMIAAVASRTGATLLAHDVDMSHIAGIVGIDLDHASTSN